MKLNLEMSLVFLASLAALPAPYVHAAEGDSDGTFHTETVYGEDSRKNLFEITDQKTLKIADATVGLFDAADAIDQGNGNVRIKSQKYGESEGLCSTEKFYNENEGAWCSGTLIAPNVVITAGHCIQNQVECAKTAFAFGYSYSHQGDDPELRPKTEIYGCKLVLSQTLDQAGRGMDYSIVQLDRPVTGHLPVTLGNGANLANGTALTVIGHPSGLPTKVATGKVRDNAAAQPYYVTNLDTFAGNSGSGVFNSSTGTYEGILVRGDTDFKTDAARNCTVSNVNPEDGGRGEDVTKLSAALLRTAKTAIQRASGTSTQNPPTMPRPRPRH